VGNQVQFTNLDGAKHTSTEDNKLFETKLLAKDESEMIIFNDIGEFNYYCVPHPWMKAKIIVK
jgi:plastocyanin